MYYCCQFSKKSPVYIQVWFWECETCCYMDEGVRCSHKRQCCARSGMWKWTNIDPSGKILNCCVNKLLSHFSLKPNCAIYLGDCSFIRVSVYISILQLLYSDYSLLSTPVPSFQHKKGFRDLTGVDYVQAAVDLGKSVAEEYEANITYEVTSF